MIIIAALLGVLHLSVLSGAYAGKMSPVAPGGEGYPSVVQCGDGPVLSGRDHAGTIIVGSGSVYSCRMVFSVPLDDVPICVATLNKVGTVRILDVSKTSVLFRSSSVLSGGRIYYHCLY